MVKIHIECVLKVENAPEKSNFTYILTNCVFRWGFLQTKF